MLDRDVAPGIHRVEDANTNWYLIEDRDELCVVDAGLPASWGSLKSALVELDRSFDDLRAVVLTHAHFDHVGFAERLRREHGVPVWVHEREAELVRHPLRYEHERAILPYLRHLRAVPVLLQIGLAGALLVKGVESVRTFAAGDVLPVPGRPRVVFTPGHTHGHSSLWYEDRGAVVAGDAVVTLDPYTGRRGPRIVAGAATADSPLALCSLEVLAETGAATVLVGHGEPWREGAPAACELAWEAGAA